MIDAFNDTIGSMLREQMQKIIWREQYVQDFMYDLTAPPITVPRLGGGYSVHYNRNQIVKDDRPRKGMFYDLDDYKLGIFIDENEIRFVLFDLDYNSLQTASSVWYETMDGSHFAVRLKEADFDTFGDADTPMSIASDDDRGNAVMKLMMINEAAK